MKFIKNKTPFETKHFQKDILNISPFGQMGGKKENLK